MELNQITYEDINKQTEKICYNIIYNFASTLLNLKPLILSQNTLLHTMQNNQSLLLDLISQHTMTYFQVYSHMVSIAQKSRPFDM